MLRSILYLIARLIGDYKAIEKGKTGQRIKRRVAGRLAGKALKKLK